MIKNTNVKILLKESNPEIVEKLMKELNLSLPSAQILAARGLTTYEECKKFFNPSIDNFYDPFLFKDMQKTVERISFAIKNKENITIYGDYDVDGITSTVLLCKALKAIGADCNYYLPNRLKDGYGISCEGIKKIKENGSSLIISVDCGISALEEVNFANSLGLDIIITDHHECGEKLPNAFSVLNPKVSNCNYPFKYLAGVGVALKLVQGLCKHLKVNDELWIDMLDIVALGTAADIVPLIDENRIIAKFGFDKMQHTNNPGLAALIQEKKLTNKEISTSDIVFRIAPSINASGRLGSPEKSVKLLLEDDIKIASTLAKKLCSLNNERQCLDKNVKEDVVYWIENNVDIENSYTIVAGSENWHIGVIGIVASKIVELYNKPVFLFSIDENGIAKGSGRSIPPLNLVEVLEECSHLLESFGGHHAAAGASLKMDNIAEFRRCFEEAVQKRLTQEDLIPQIEVDAEIELSNITPNFLNILKRMEPFGPKNMRPVLYCRDLQTKEIPRIVGQNHLKFTVTKDNIDMDAIAFNMGNRIDDISNNENYSLVFTLSENNWNGIQKFQMTVKEIIQ